MTTFDDILAFVKAQARLNGTSRDAQLGMVINKAYRSVCSVDYWPFLRTVATPLALVAGTQNYALPADYERMAIESVFVYTTGTTNYCQLSQVYPPNSEIWEGLTTSDYAPTVFTIPAGSTNGLRTLRLLPNFTQTNLSLNYVYYKQPAELSAGSIIGDPLLCDAIAYWVLASDKDFTRDQDFANADYLNEYRLAVRQARSAILS